MKSNSGFMQLKRCFNVAIPYKMQSVLCHMTKWIFELQKNVAKRKFQANMPKIKTDVFF